MKRNNLYLGLVTPSSGCRTPIVCVKGIDIKEERIFVKETSTFLFERT
jgi:hypothetical protein